MGHLRILPMSKIHIQYQPLIFWKMGSDVFLFNTIGLYIKVKDPTDKQPTQIHQQWL